MDSLQIQDAFEPYYAGRKQGFGSTKIEEAEKKAADRTDRRDEQPPTADQKH